MKKIHRFSFIVAMLVLVSGCTSVAKKGSADAIPPPPKTILETDLLQPKPGYTGRVLGARVTESKTGPGGEQQIIDIDVPVDPEKVDEIQVVSETGEIVKQSKTAEILRNYESDNVGITIFISREKNLNFRLRLIDSSEEN